MRARMLRFSGSKASVVEELLGHMAFKDSPETVFWDVFAGSGSVAEGVARKYDNVRIVMNDLDQNLSALHRVVVEGNDSDFDGLLGMLDIVPTMEKFREVLRWEPTSARDRAFKAMFLNRTCDSRAYGLRPMGGWKQEGEMRVTSRYKHHNMVKTMLERRMLLKGRTTVTGDDFRAVLPRASATPGSFAYCDPVYLEVGDDLYHNTPKWALADHIQLRDLLLGMDKWLLSYNNHSLIATLYSSCDIRSMEMPSHSQGGAKTELLIRPK